MPGNSAIDSSSHHATMTCFWVDQLETSLFAYDSFSALVPRRWVARWEM